MVLSRDPTTIFMTTYLPTIIINVINAATSYWEGPQLFEAVVTVILGQILIKLDLIQANDFIGIQFTGQVNLTCLMVLAALYISVSESLTGTSSKVTRESYY